MAVPFLYETLPHITAGIFSLALATDTILDIEPSAFYTAEEASECLALPYTVPEFQLYFAQAWASFQANCVTKDKLNGQGKKVQFHSVKILVCWTMCPDLRAVSVVEKIISPELQESAKKPLSGLTKTSALKWILPTSLSSTPAPSANMGLPFYSAPQGQYKYSFLLEDKSAPKCVLEKVLQMSVPVMVKDIFAVTPEL